MLLVILFFSDGSLNQILSWLSNKKRSLIIDFERRKSFYSWLCWEENLIRSWQVHIFFLHCPIFRMPEQLCTLYLQSPIYILNPYLLLCRPMSLFSYNIRKELVTPMQTDTCTYPSRFYKNIYLFMIFLKHA